MKQPFPAVQVVDRPRPSDVPDNFCSWQFVMWQPGMLSKDAEIKAMSLLVSLLEDVVRVRSGHYVLEHCPRQLVEDIVADLTEHCSDIHAAVRWSYEQLQDSMAA